MICGSAGSLDVLLRILPELKAKRFPIIVVIHRKNSEDHTLENLVARKTKLTVREVEDHTVLYASSIYIAPADYHLLFDSNKKLALDISEKVNHSRPSIDVSMKSAAAEYGQGMVAILLSGANSDGSEGLLKIKELNGYAVVQNPEDAEVPYMPAAAIKKMQPDKILRSSEMAAFINGIE